MAEYCNALGMLKNEYSTDSSSDENCDTFGTPIDSYVSQEKRIAGSRYILHILPLDCMHL